MDRKDLLRLRIRRYVPTKNLKTLAGDYLPEHSGYFTKPELFQKRETVLNELDLEQVVDNNYDAILLKVDGWLC